MEESYRSRYEKHKRKRKRRQMRIAFVLLIPVLIIGAILFWPSADPEVPEVEEYENGEPYTTEINIGLNTAVLTISVPLSELTDTYFLELINLWNPIRREPDISTFVTVWPDISVLSSDLILHESARTALGDWFHRAEAEGVTADFFLTHGYRSNEYQAALYDITADSDLVKPPGHSEHHTGLAIDISLPDVSAAEMKTLPEFLWLAETAWEHGFILRYPDGMSHITGIGFEPWHFRYVGNPHAFYMHTNNLVLEEYIDHLIRQGVLSITVEGRRYEVWHQMPYNDMIYIPESLPFSVSNDNMGGYIVTVEITS